MKDEAYAKFLKLITNTDYWTYAFDDEFGPKYVWNFNNLTGMEFSKDEVVRVVNNGTPEYSGMWYQEGKLWHASTVNVFWVDNRYLEARRRRNILKQPSDGYPLTIRGFKRKKKEHIEQITDEVRTAVDLGYSVLLEDIGVIFHAEEEAEGLPERFEGLESAEPEVLLRML